MAFTRNFYDFSVTIKEIIYSFSSDFLIDENNWVASELRSEIRVPYPGSTGCIDRGDSFFTTWQAAKGYEKEIGRTAPEMQMYKVGHHGCIPYSEAKLFMERYGKGIREDGIKIRSLPIHPALQSRALEIKLEYQRKRFWIVAKQCGIFSDENGSFREIEIRLESDRPGKTQELLVIRERLTDDTLIRALEDDIKWAFWSSFKLLEALKYPIKHELYTELLHEAEWYY